MIHRLGPRLRPVVHMGLSVYHSGKREWTQTNPSVVFFTQPFSPNSVARL